MISYGDIKSGEVVVPVAEDHGIALGVIQIDGGTQSRASLNDQVVNDYADAIKAGATFPPIVVFYDGEAHWLADGFHRFHACQRAGRTSIAADIRQAPAAMLSCTASAPTKRMAFAGPTATSAAPS
ncbi:ParB N-terminal domain-containing protein [Pseudaminobacter salicylatoxidans]|uniref:ParB N-terminal domain-containing protein n=1 Tax=Pseudaminobacter salicylatoxidans TaxID=93369 RepID=UPI0002EE14ED|nr:ParB N-terminal domain-containing protein [Pseudaminobacter salicylatoxidans]